MIQLKSIQSSKTNNYGRKKGYISIILKVYNLKTVQKAVSYRKKLYNDASMIQFQWEHFVGSYL